MKADEFLGVLGAHFYTGVPDSQLKELCNYLMKNDGIGSRHIIAANEGNCAGIAAGHYLATGEIPVVYMQNSGLGNVINPLASLMHPKVYGIPCIFVIGWRGEPGIHDEPQHIFQGEVTKQLLQTMEVKHFVVDSETTVQELSQVMQDFREELKEGKSVAFVIKKNAFSGDEVISYQNDNLLEREIVIQKIADVASQDVIVCTTGKASRELFEIRERNGQGHGHDFLTVGSMGHSSSIALGIALEKKDTKVWCVDGDGAALMHMGAMALLGSNKPSNFVHVILNNGAHETVGGMPTVSEKIDWCRIAEGCGYPCVLSVSREDELETVLQHAQEKEELVFLEAKCSIGSRKELGRPTTTPKENKQAFMEFLRKE